MKLHRLAPWLVLAIVGCTGTDADVSTSGSFALDAVPLPTIHADLWQPARAGCEAALAPSISFGIAEGAPDLVVAIGPDGVVCVDTYSAVESELAVVDPDAIDALWLGYMASLQEAEPFDDGRRPIARSADHPAPRLYDYTAPVRAEPQPRPSHPVLTGIDPAPAEAEPQPRPSDPTPEATGSRNTDATEHGIDMSDDLDRDPPTEPVSPRIR